MEYLIAVLLGTILGMSLAGYYARIKINKQDKKILNKNAMIKNRDDLIEDQRTKLSQIKATLKEQQYNSVENLTNKIKSILFNDRKSEK